ncbi:MAG: CRTAC1 family protein [Gemmatimonadetes bacterium]|nr:CRTAC1 family protein [Gemmatimonadota bacterium]MDA1104819.1 CRTAC1 family protein [Gemmatimonadota bacterium]
MTDSHGRFFPHADPFMTSTSRGCGTLLLIVTSLLSLGCGAESRDAPAAVDPAPSFSALQPELFADFGGQPNAWADFDGDGDLDLFVGFRGRPNRLYRNDRGTFVDVAAEVGLADPEETRAAAWGDYDLDGDLDLYVGFAAGESPGNRLYRNDDGGQRFVDVAGALGVDRPGTSRQPVFIDYDGDGDLDLFVAFRDLPNALFRNDGGSFTDVTERSGIGDERRTVGVVWFDMDGDGDLDVFVANQNGDDDGFYRNLGDGRFEDVAPALGMAQPGRTEVQGSVGVAVSDYDNDGDLDLFVASYGPDVLWQNQGDGTFRDVAPGTPLAGDHHSVAAAWGDYDNDGWVDLYVGTFVATEPEAADHLFRNVGGRFEEVTPAAFLAKGASHGVVWTDFDSDGDLDLSLMNNHDPEGTHPLYLNTLDPARSVRSLNVAVTDSNGRWNRAGATITLRSVPELWSGPAFVSSRLMDTGGGYSSQGVGPVHFGLPEGSGRLSVSVTWYEGGERRSTTVSGVDPDRFRGRWFVLSLGVG